MARPRLTVSLGTWTAPLRRNLGAKLFAAGFAFSLWLFVNAGQRENQVFQFPVELRNTPEGTVVVNANRVDAVDVKLNGPGPLLASLDTRRLPIRLDLSDVRVGPEIRLKIRDSMIHLPRGVRLLDVEPSRVPVRLEKVEQRTVPVHLTQMGGPRQGYRIESIHVMPNRATVSGPASLIAPLKEIETEPLDLSGESKSSQRAVALVRPGALIAVEPARVTVAVTIQQVMATREFKDVAVAVRNVDQPFRLQPSHVNLTVRGPEDTVASLKVEPGTVFVDGRQYGAGEHSVEASATLPAGVQVVEWTPPSLSLTILEAPKDGAQE
jgi:YbbR domain-containing protein